MDMIRVLALGIPAHYIRVVARSFWSGGRSIHFLVVEFVLGVVGLYTIFATIIGYWKLLEHKIFYFKVSFFW